MKFNWRKLEREVTVGELRKFYTPTIIRLLGEDGFKKCQK